MTWFQTNFGKIVEKNFPLLNQVFRRSNKRKLYTASLNHLVVRKPI